MTLKTIKFQKNLPTFITKNSRKKCTKETQACRCDDDSSVATATLTASERSDVSNDLRVQFAPEVAVRTIFSLERYTSEEIEACWLQKQEYFKIRKKCVERIKKMEIGYVLQDRKYRSRGLESFTRVGSIAKTENRRKAFEAVWLEQLDQRELGVVDEESIARRYHNASSSCQLWARRVGLQDQRAVEG